MTYFSVSLEVPFRLGDNAEFNQDPAFWMDGVKPFVRIDVVLLETPIPDLTTTDGIYFTSPRLADELKELSGLRERDYTLAFDDQMKELGEFGGGKVPELMCFEVTGRYGRHDFAHVNGLTDLLVSEQALAMLRHFDLGDLADIRPFRTGTCHRPR